MAISDDKNHMVLKTMKKLVITRLEFENGTATKVVVLVVVAFFCMAILLFLGEFKQTSSKFHEILGFKSLA